MANETGCGVWGADTWSAVATGIAAAIALGVWIHGIFLARIGQKKRIRAALHLMVEELSRTSYQALEIWRVVNARNFRGEALVQISQDVELALNIHRAEVLAQHVERLPSSLGEELAKFISHADMLRQAFASIERNLISTEAGKTVNSVYELKGLANLSEKLMKQAASLATQLEMETKAEQGSIKKSVASFENLVGMVATIRYRE